MPPKVRDPMDDEGGCRVPLLGATPNRTAKVSQCWGLDARRELSLVSELRAPYFQSLLAQSFNTVQIESRNISESPDPIWSIPCT